jgi:alcohol dehydrogenase (cytochrome c)
MTQTITPRFGGALLLGAVCSAALATAALAQGPAVRPPNPEANNVLARNEDALFNAAVAKRTATLAKLTPVTEAVLQKPADGDWLTYRRAYESTGYSPLKQISKANVGRLNSAWSWLLPQGGNEITPLVHDGVIFIESGATVQALDGVTGDLLWSYVRQLPAAMNAGRTNIVKNIAIYGDRIFAPTADGHMIALDAKTGKLIWDHEVLGAAELKVRVNLDGGPIVAKGKVIMGTSSCQTYPGGCFIFGLDAETGKEAWRFHTLAHPGEVGGDSWNGTPVEQRYGGAVWTSGSYDPDLGLVYFGTGQTYDTATLLQPQAEKSASSDGLFTDSTVALDPETGKLKWHFQHVNRDVWDLDWVFEQPLVTLQVKGKPTKLVVTGGKIALFDAVDRATGKYAFSRDLGIQTLVTAIDPITGAKTIDPLLAKHEPGVTLQLCPHSGGGRNWPATSIDTVSKIMYVQLYETCQDFTWKPRDASGTAAGGNDMQWVLKARPGSDGKFGRVQAINLETGKTIWTNRQRAAFASSTLVTAGGLVFVGGRDRYFNAFDSATGKTLWRTRLPASPSSTPVTYSVGGKQYVAVVAGNGGPVAWPYMTPEIDNPTGGDVLMVFELPAGGGAPVKVAAKAPAKGG